MILHNALISTHPELSYTQNMVIYTAYLTVYCIYSNLTLAEQMFILTAVVKTRVLPKETANVKGSGSKNFSTRTVSSVWIWGHVLAAGCWWGHFTATCRSCQSYVCYEWLQTKTTQKRTDLSEMPDTESLQCVTVHWMQHHEHEKSECNQWDHCFFFFPDAFIQIHHAKSNLPSCQKHNVSWNQSNQFFFATIVLFSIHFTEIFYLRRSFVYSCHPSNNFVLPGFFFSLSWLYTASILLQQRSKIWEITPGKQDPGFDTFHLKSWSWA